MGFMELRFYSTLSTRTRRAMRRKAGKFGRPYRYKPRSDLVQRLSEETGLTFAQVYNQLVEEHLFLKEKQW